MHSCAIRGSIWISVGIRLFVLSSFSLCCDISPPQIIQFILSVVTALKAWKIIWGTKIRTNNLSFSIFFIVLVNSFEQEIVNGLSTARESSVLGRLHCNTTKLALWNVVCGRIIWFTIGLNNQHHLIYFEKSSGGGT